MSLSVLQAAAEAPERAALSTEDACFTYGELGRRVSATIAWLDSQGARSELVAVVGTSDLATIVLMHALFETGTPVALLHPRLMAPERNRALAALGAPALLTPPRVTRAAALLAPREVLDDAATLAVLHTSGTSGEPKCVELSRAAFVASARASERNLGWRDDDRWLLGLPIAHVGGLSILTRCLLARACVTLPRTSRFDAATLASSIARDRITLLSLVPTQLHQLLHLEPLWRPPAHLRAVLLGGAPASADLLARARDRGMPILTTYGLTEACSQVSTQRYSTPPGAEQGAGCPIDGTEVRIVDGGIRVRGPTLMTGYFPAGAAPPAFDADGWLVTGDLGHFDDAGRLHVHGRRDDVIVTGGENVHPAEVEMALSDLSSVAASCVFGVDDDRWGQVVAVAIVPRDARTVDAESLRRHIEARLASHKRPRLFATLESLVANDHGKIDRAAVRRRALGSLTPLRGS